MLLQADLTLVPKPPPFGRPESVRTWCLALLYRAQAVFILLALFFFGLEPLLIPSQSSTVRVSYLVGFAFRHRMLGKGTAELSFFCSRQRHFFFPP